MSNNSNDDEAVNNNSDGGRAPPSLALPIAHVLDSSSVDDSFTIVLGRGDEDRVLWRVRPKREDAMEPADWMNLLRSASWKQVLQSGGEYSYWTARTAPSCAGGIGQGRWFDVEVVDRVTPKLLSRYGKQTRRLTRETPAMYAERSAKAESPEWVAAIIRGEKEVDRVLAKMDDPREGFVIVADSKWRDFPDNAAFPYLLAITNRSDLFTIRELRKEDVPMLVNIRDTALNVLRDRFDIPAESVRCFFHYPPQFDWLHVHFCLVNDPRADASVERAHLLDDVIERLSNNSTFYADATLTAVEHA